MSVAVSDIPPSFHDQPVFGPGYMKPVHVPTKAVCIYKPLAPPMIRPLGIRPIRKPLIQTRSSSRRAFPCNSDIFEGFWRYHSCRAALDVPEIVYLWLLSGSIELMMSMIFLVFLQEFGPDLNTGQRVRVCCRLTSSDGTQLKVNVIVAASQMAP